MTLKEKLISDVHNAMRSGDRDRVSVLRLLRSSIGYEEIRRQDGLDDTGVIDVIAREVRQRRESIELYGRANRQDLVDKENLELTILQEYLPPQLTLEELTSLAKIVIENVGVTGPSDKGKVMSKLMPQVRGKAEGKMVNEVVSTLLDEVQCDLA